MKIKVVILKNWCNKNITPLAWQRIIIKVLPQYRERGFSLEDLENPQDNHVFGDEEFRLFTTTLETLYGISFPKEVLQKMQ